MRPLPPLALAFLLCIPAAAADPNAPAPELKAPDVASAASTMHATAAQESASRPLFLVKPTVPGHDLMGVFDGQLDKPYLLTATISRGVGENNLYSGSPIGNFLVAFRRNGDLLELYRLNTKYRAAPGSPEAQAVKDSYPDSLLGAVEISTYNASAHLMIVDAGQLFLTDLAGIHFAVAAAYDIPPQALKGIPGVSHVEKIAAFHANVEIETSYVFQPVVPVDSKTLPDSRTIPVAVRYSLSQLPDGQGFDERPSDPRVGFFSTNYRDYSAKELKNRLDPAVRLANHWRLEKTVPGAPVSDVKNPIVWWLDPAMPKEYRGAVKAGILAWNSAFEAIGLRHAMVVKEVDKDMTPDQRKNFNPADASYNVVRWFLGPDAGFAFGPSRVNPLTGQIYSATVMLSDQMSRLWDISTHPELASAIDKDVRPDATALAAIRAEGLTDAQKQDIVKQYLTSVVVHEIGHTLGLRHNFKGSRLYPLDKEGTDGLLSSSVMDYTPTNVPMKGQPQVYFQDKIGPYDRWAIAYGYKPLPQDPTKKAEALAKIAAQANSDPVLAYGNDEDAKGIDPDVQRFDLSSTPVRYSDSLVSRAQALWARSASGQIPRESMSGYDALVNGLDLYSRSVETLLPEIGGVRSDRRPIPEGGPHLAPVPAAEQTKALDFLSRRVFAPDAFQVPPALVLNASPDPLATSSGRGLINVPAVALSIQRRALAHLYSPAVMSRLVTAEQYAPASALPVSDLFTKIHDSVWSELAPPADPGLVGSVMNRLSGKQAPPVKIPLLRRQLERADVSALAALASDPGTPGDAAALARQELTRIASEAADAAGRAASPEVKAHLTDVARMAGEAAGAPIAQN
jgi:hypothetical protein